MADLHIDTSNVTLMSEFKDAVEEYVKKYVDSVIGGIHSHKNNSWKFEGGTSEKIHEINAKIDCSLDKTKDHWGVINIQRSDSGNFTTYGGVQIFFWVTNSEFQYTLNTKTISKQDNDNYRSQTVEDVVYTDGGITIKIANHTDTKNYPSASFSIDYHIW